MTLATDWDFRDVRGWHWAEKFDGCRAYWDGFKFWTRGGNIINAPAHFLASLPAGVPLDGEIWAGRGGFEIAKVAVEFSKWHDSIRFVAFDAPSASGNWLKRMKLADSFRNEVLETPERGIIQTRDEASDRAASIIELGGEGLMLRNPDIKFYQRQRTINLMRIKIGNLYAPWHGAKPQIKFGKFGGLDLSLWPFDPQMEYEILH
jgi:DNA ligase-1